MEMMSRKKKGTLGSGKTQILLLLMSIYTWDWDHQIRLMYVLPVGETNTHLFSFLHKRQHYQRCIFLCEEKATFVFVFEWSEVYLEEGEYPSWMSSSLPDLCYLLLLPVVPIGPWKRGQWQEGWSPSCCSWFGLLSSWCPEFLSLLFHRNLLFSYRPHPWFLTRWLSYWFWFEHYLKSISPPFSWCWFSH